MTINELQNNVIEEFADFDDWMDKYALLIDLGNSLPPLEEKYKTESNLIEGCQSRVWLQADYVDEVWEAARNLGYGKYFINANGGGVTDDHEAVIEETGIPCLDIINYDPNSDKGFRDHWHTQNDNMSNIDKNVLKAVGQTVLEVVYNR